MLISSPVFQPNGLIPQKYTCDGEYFNPPVNIAEVPQSAKSLALIVEDPDAPVGLWVHWMIWDMPPTVSIIIENSTPPGVVGKNSSGNTTWDDICPPNGTHRYFFKLFALNEQLGLDPTTTTREEFYKCMEGHILQQSELMGRYKRKIN